MKKLPARWNGIVFPFVLSILMSGVVSFVSTLRAIGFHSGLLGKWLSAWGLSWIVAFPVVIVVLPAVRRIVGVLVEPPPGPR